MSQINASKPPLPSTPRNLGLRKLGKNIARTLLQQTVTLLFTCGLFVLLAQVLGPEGNGRYSVSILLPTILATLLNLGIAPANVYFLGQNAVSMRTALRSSIVFWIYLSVSGSSITGVFVVYFSDAWFPGIPSMFLWLALLAFPPALLNAFLLSLLQGVQDFKRYNRVRMIAPMITLISAVIIVWGLRWGVVGALAAFVLGQLFGMFASLVSVKVCLLKHTPRTNADDRERYIWKCIRFGWKAHLSNILAHLNYRADIFLVNLLLSPSAAGIYVVAVLIAERTWIFAQATNTVIFPRLSELSSDEITRKIITPLISRWVFVISMLIAIFLALVSDQIIRFIFGENFISAYDALMWLLPGAVLLSMSRVLANDIAARGKPEINLYIAAIVFLVNIVANIVLIPELGINGAAVATTLSYIVHTFATHWFYAHESGNPWWRTFIPDSAKWKPVQLISIIRRYSAGNSRNGKY